MGAEAQAKIAARVARLQAKDERRNPPVDMDAAIRQAKAMRRGQWRGFVISVLAAGLLGGAASGVVLYVLLLHHLAH